MSTTGPAIGSEKSILVADVSPLWETHYTGISNVVYELSRRFLTETRFDVQFSVFGKAVDRDMIAKCVQEKTGASLHEIFRSGKKGVTDIAIADGKINGRRAYGLYTNTKPPRRVFTRDSQIFYDFSFFLTPECHTSDTIKHHTTGIGTQVQSCDLFFCISESTASDLRWLFSVPSDDVVVSLLGSNVDHHVATEVREAIAGRSVEPFLLILGTIEPRKNTTLVFEWLRRHPAALQKYRIVFAGREGWGPTFAELVSRYGLEAAVAAGRIVHHGYVDEVLKTTLLMGAAAVMYPSLFEGFGLPVLEAMSLNTPVICSCSTSLPEVLGEEGYYFDPCNLTSFEQAIAAFEADRLTGALQLRCEAARQRAATFSYDNTYATIAGSLAERFNL